MCGWLVLKRESCHWIWGILENEKWINLIKQSKDLWLVVSFNFPPSIRTPSSLPSLDLKIYYCKQCFAKSLSSLSYIFSSVQSLSHVWLFVSPWMAIGQASLYITNSWSSSKPMSIESVMPSNHLILCHPLLLLPSIFPNIRVFSNESALHIRWPKYWSFLYFTSTYLSEKFKPG